jgi:hypothetical protein
VTRTPSLCRVHRPILIDLVDRGDRGPATPAALDHLAVCRGCEEELTELALTIATLRRVGAVYRALPEPSFALSRSSAGDRRAEGVGGRRRPWSWRLQLGSLVTGAVVAAVLVAPRAGLAPSAPYQGQPEPPHPGLDSRWRAAESLLASRPDIAPAAARVASRATSGTLPPRYPDGLVRPRKEVPATDATARAFEPR